MVLKLDAKGLIPAIVQDASTGQVLTMAYMSPDSLKLTLEEGQVWFYSRSREDLWHKGETSGNFLDLQQALVDCDGDTLLIKAKPSGPTCHTGNESCFFQQLEPDPSYQIEAKGPNILDELYAVIQDRKRQSPETSYTAKLVDSGISRIAQKVIEEAGEVSLAAATQDKDSIPSEIADLLYHVLVLISASDTRPEQVWEELRRRRG